MILVTGATGTVGSEIVRQLRATKTPFKIAVTLLDKVASAKAEGLDAVVLDYTRPETFASALEGINKLFLLSPPGRTELEAGVVDAARKAGVKQIVKLSVYGADGEDFYFGREHRAMEKHIEDSDVPYTFLRPNGFMQNYYNNFGQSIAQQGTFYLAQGDSRYSMIDVRDIAAVAVKALTQAGHENNVYTLTGPEALNNFEVAEKLSLSVGKPVKYVPVSDEDMWKALSGMGTPAGMIDAILDLMHYYIAGKAEKVTNDVERVTGRKPISFDQFARDYADRFKGTAAAD